MADVRLVLSLLFHIEQVVHQSQRSVWRLGVSAKECTPYERYK